ncbi:MAG: ferredoxin [Acidimicrobiales bacterium]|jgi:ferredoxin|nr:ferredoxin [Acidimicrobiales bacterium]MDP6299403.1 ferredoxin [Acidimicrobiales bacterium]HJM28215.1 ferredoxin [Acidimicrobiales bacterium]HJM98393.1 ferredoxin [Acidimicrobiales bacterium]
MKDKEFHLKVDNEICQGTGYCVRISSDLFSINGRETAQVLIPHPSHNYQEDILEASTLCPTRAITY